MAQLLTLRTAVDVAKAAVKTAEVLLLAKKTGSNVEEAEIQAKEARLKLAITQTAVKSAEQKVPKTAAQIAQKEAALRPTLIYNISLDSKKINKIEINSQYKTKSDPRTAFHPDTGLTFAYLSLL